MGAVLETIPMDRPEVNMTDEHADFVLELIKEHQVVIFSKSYCPYSLMAKQHFQKLSVPVYAIELDSRDDAIEIQNILGELTGSRTVPRCFINGKCVGGGTDIKRLYEQGLLQKYFEKEHFNED